MTAPVTIDAAVRQKIILFLLGTVLFAAAYTQAPLYYSNQNQYYLHGLAQAGGGFLSEDWLANTKDPTPIFSALVTVMAGVPWLFHVVYALLMGAYAAALVGIFAKLVGPSLAAGRWPVFFALLVAVHAAAARWLSFRLFGLDYPWYFQAGLAGQYLLGGMLQPSCFGVLLVVASALFLWERAWWAAACVALAATIHSTYLLPGALLTLGFLGALCREGRTRQALTLGVVTLVLVLPVCAYVLLTFRPTSSDTFAAAQDILVNFRIPHHSRPDLWFDPIAFLQMAWIAVAIYLARQTRLLLILCIPFVLMLLLTALQVMTGSDTLALLFPWRISTVLVPVATTVVLARLVALPGIPFERQPWRLASFGLAGLAALSGILIILAKVGYRTGEEEVPMMDFVRQTVRSGDVYLLPVRLPNLAKTTRGSFSSDFKPLAEKRGDTRLIPVDLQRFRLHTEAPIFGDFKAIPYKDTEVLAWRARLDVVQKIQEQIQAGRGTEALDTLGATGVTHVVLPASQELAEPEFERTFADSFYQVFRIKRKGM